MQPRLRLSYGSPSVGADSLIDLLWKLGPMFGITRSPVDWEHDLQFTLQPTSRSVVETVQATFTAHASGNPSYQWQRNTGSGFSNISGQTGSSLTITASLADDGNVYRVVVTKAGQSITSDEVTLTVTENLGIGFMTIGSTFQVA